MTTISTSTCRAVVLTDFGDVSQLALREIARPAVSRPDSMLVRVRATGVNPIEWKMREGLAGMRLVAQRRLGKPMILGLDFAGEVVATGAEVLHFRPGDAVFGTIPWGGSYSEYLLVRPSDPRTAVARIPQGCSFEDVGAAPFAALVAYAGLVGYGRLALPDQVRTPVGPRVLIVGASGGVGHLAVQIAKHGLDSSFVVGVCSSRNAAFAQGIGADNVIAHDQTPIEQIAALHPEWRNSFDLIFDTIGVDAYYTTLAPQLLKPKGRFVTAALPPSRPGAAGEDVDLRSGAALVARMLRRMLGGRYALIPGLLVGLPVQDGFPRIVRWMGEGKLRVHPWKQFELAQMQEAHLASETGAAVGKIVVTVP